MAYSSNSHLGGAVITAAHAENWETQYSQIKATYMDRFSTASTGTTLLSCASTFSVIGGAYIPLMYFPIPPGIQKSRFEFSITGYYSSGIGAGNQGNVYLVRGEPVTAYTTVPYQYAAYIGSSWSTGAAGMTKTTGFTAYGGEWISVMVYNAYTTNFLAWNIKISGTSTTITDNSSLVFQWTTNPYGIPTSTG
jgi:hypothetical protein